MEIIRDLLWLWILGALGGGSYIVYALYVRSPAPAGPRTTGVRRPVPPVARPVTPGPVTRPTPAAAAGVEAQRRGSAPTTRLPEAQPAPPAPPPAIGSPSGEPRRTSAQASREITDRAGRIEEIGFHVGSKAAEARLPAAEPASPPSPPSPPPAAAPAVQVAAERGASEPAPGQARTQTQELDDILKRIDAVLSESNATASEATLTSQASAGQPTMSVAQPPPTEKVDRRGTDPNQQKLF